ncbi:MAG: hypothetical protein H7A43_04460 [Verrucomicrobia bacterium]|nr:hypothetical protein [Verrucomicrobiota bacterium]
MIEWSVPIPITRRKKFQTLELFDVDFPGIGTFPARFSNRWKNWVNSWPFGLKARQSTAQGKQKE